MASADQIEAGQESHTVRIGDHDHLGVQLSSAAVSELDVGDRVRLAWTDTSGHANTAAITLGAGPVG